MIDSVDEFSKCNGKMKIFIIKDLSTQLKSLIREHLNVICHGIDNVFNFPLNYSYKETVKEFNIRYNEKSSNLKIGMIGELLTHILLIFQEEYSIISPFFNLEERSIKKGFDVVLVQRNDYSKYWITEVKSGSKGITKSSIRTTKKHISKAKLDLVRRINQNNSQLWYNAINGAKQTLMESNKKEILQLLNNSLHNSQTKTLSSNKENVILVSVLFDDLNDIINAESLIPVFNKIENDTIFNDFIIFAIQKETYEKVALFLQAEEE